MHPVYKTTRENGVARICEI